MNNTNLKLNKTNRKNKENLLKCLVILEMQEKINNQELAFVFLQKDD